MITQHSAGIVIYTIKNNQPYYLLLHHGGRYWNFPKGKLEKGESTIEAAYREVWEETGIPKDIIRLHRGFQRHYYYRFRVEEGRIIDKKVTFYLGSVLSQKIHISKEHENYGWFSYDLSMEKLRYRNSQKLIMAANDFLEKNIKIK